MNQLAIAAKRVLAIDVFRGITILTMVFVNELAGVSNVPGWMKHLPADVDGMTFVDLVFPAFLFIVGMSIPFASAARLNKGATLPGIFNHVLIRSLSLMIIGVFMVNSEAGFNQSAMALPMPAWTLLMYAAVLLIWCQYPRHAGRFTSTAAKLMGVALLIMLWALYRSSGGGGMSPQWWGILGLIGWAYLLASAVYLLALNATSAAFHVAILAGATIAFIGLFFLLGTINSDSAVLGFVIENNRNHTHAAIVLAGALLSTLFYNAQLSALKLRSAVTFSIVSGLLALASWQVSPISKIWATPSWALFSIFFCSVIFAATYWMVDVRGRTRWCQLFAPAAANPLLVYILPYILIAAASLAGVHYRPAFFDSGLAGISWSLAFAFVMMGITALLTRAGIKLKL
ncbi:DUF5009 domain-containing protein [Gilvimarinus agarilyticus]|uniref:DUF5009 domain-containing protein n=1 Tax=Gilvimarinus agarilyticus TaxID=679259 RepID=UPI0005A0C4B9|nr:DUF5009 domain-containing protein [Gilvimarinus agarilyticus]